MLRSMFVAVVALVAAFAAPALAAEPRKPNLVAIVTDDQARWTLGCYGGIEIPTPNLDRLAREGVRFTNAFVHTPVCSPSRGAYLTGRLGTQLGFTDWLTHEQGMKQGVTAATPTWPAALARNGYTTGLVGKWHLGERKESTPWNNGLAEFTGDLGGGWPPNKVMFVTEKGATLTPVGFSVEICTDLAIKYLDDHKDQPFALLVHYREPHAPYAPMPEIDMKSAKAAKIQVPVYAGLKKIYAQEARRNYYASIAAVDRNVGRLLTHLAEIGLADNTVVTFTSDHGYNVGEHGIQHKGNGYWITEEQFHKVRPNMFDTSLRVPLIVRLPGEGERGGVADEWVTNADMFATVLGLLGIERPADAPPNSRDFSPAARGQKLPAEKFPRELFGQYDLVNSGDGRRMRMLRTDRWKLILHLNAPDQHELYDLEADPGELTNRFGRRGNEVTVDKLTDLIRKHMSIIHDPRLNEVR